MFRFHKDDEDGGKALVGRDVFVVALFTEKAFPSAITDVEEAFDHWLRAVPEKELEWAQIGPNATGFKALTKTSIQRCRDQLSPTKVKDRALAAFDIRGGEDPHNPSYGFTFYGSKPAPMVPDRTCLVEMRWPSEYPEALGHDAFVDWVCELAALLPYRSGYAAPALSRGWENSKHIEEAARNLIPLAFRHPGYDLFENEGTAARMPRDRCRGARWLTLLGPALVDALGGRSVLEQNLDSNVTIRDAGRGLLLRAGERPELGDVNHGDRAPLLRSVAGAIESVTYFEDVYSLQKLFLHDEEQLLRWERRHLA